MNALLKGLVPQPVRATIRDAQDHLRQRQWANLSPRYALKSGIDVTVESDGEWVIFTGIFVDGEYDRAIDYLIAHALDDRAPLVLDLGANVGYFLARLLDRWQTARGAQPLRVVAVEGSPAVFPRLQAWVAAHEQFTGMVSVHHGLVGRRAGSAVMHEHTSHITNSVHGVGNGPRVPYVDVETLLPGGQRVSLLKCDIEGSEETFLEAYPYLLRRTDAVVIEVHGDRCDPWRCFDLLAQAGLTERQELDRWRDYATTLVTRA